MGMPMPDPKSATPRWLAALPIIYLLTGLAWILGSDLIVGWIYRDDLRALVYASTLKGGLFVTLSATLLYVLLAMRRAEFATGPGGLDPFELRKPLIAFALVGLGIATVGYVVYLLEADGVRDRARRQLETSATLAATGFSNWHEVRVRSMLQVAGSPFTGRAIAEWESKQSILLESLLRERLEAIRASHDYSSVAAVATDGRKILEAGGPIEVTADLRQMVRDATATNRVTSSWTTIEETDGHRQPVVDLVVALRDRTAGKARTVAVIIARARVQWPVGVITSDIEARHATVLLARLEGNQVGFLQPAPGVGPARYVLTPLAQAATSHLRAIQGEHVTFIARDAEKRAVLASGAPVRATPWFTLATVELATIERQIRRLMLLIAGMSALGFVATAALVLPWWRSVRVGANALIQRAESRADEMATRLGWVTRYANDVILLIDKDGRILDANDRAEQVYGYSRAELLALEVFSLRAADAAQRADARAQFAAVTKAGSLVFEATHVRKDGTPFPVEVSSRQVSLGDQQYVQSIVRDISDRRRTEERLRESEAQYRLLFKSNPHPMWVYDVETLRFLAVNDAAVDQYGYTEPEFLGMTIVEIRPEADRERLVMDVVAHADDLLQRSALWRHRRKDGTIIDVEITSHKIDFDDRRGRLVLANDVTSRLSAERSVRASEVRYRSLFENASDGVLLLGPERRILAANTEYQAMLGYSLEELHRIDLAALLDEREHARLELAAAGMRGGRPPAPATWVHRRKDGSCFTAEVRVRSLPGGDLLATVRDLTEIIAARQRIERQRDLYDLLSQCNQAIVKAGDRQVLLHSIARLAVERGRFLFAWIGEPNEAGEIVPIAKYGEDEGYVASVRFAVDPGAPGSTGPASRAMREGRAVIANDFLGDPDTACWHDVARRCGVRASAAYPIHAGGQVTAALMLYAGEAGYFDAEMCATLDEMVADVSYALDSLRTRRELDDSRLLLQSLIDASDALVFAFDLEGRAILMNDACVRALGGTRASLIGRRRDAALSHEAAVAQDTNDRRIIETGQHLVEEVRTLVSGAERVFLSVKYPLKDRDGRVYAIGGIATDITELRRMQEELAAANRLLEEKVAARTREAMAALARAEAADRAKTMFLSSMSHELRSPLHSIIGFTSVLLDGLEGELTSVQQEHLRVVSDASHHLLAIINDLLDMSKIEAGAVSLEVRSMPIGRPLARVLQRFRLQARQKGLDMRFEGTDPEIWIVGDERRIEQVLSNLVSNAIKYTPAGSVVVTCGREDSRVRIDVRDTGPGIAPEDRQQLFKRFSQLKPRRGALVEGTGLGLAIAAGLAEVMGGEIVLQSEPGVGSKFSLLLPTNPPEEGR
jgi:PAS domain S-box-containing protein